MLGEKRLCEVYQISNDFVVPIRPEAVALVALDLVERLTDGHAAPLELDMYQRQTVDEDGHVVARVVIACGLLVLVEHLQTVVVDVLFVQQVDVFGRAAVLPQHLHMIELNPARLFQNAVVCARDAVPKEARPLAVRKGVVVQTLQLAAEVGDERGFVVDLQIFIPLRAQKPQKLLLQRSLALIAVRPAGIWRVRGHDRAFGCRGDDVGLGHNYAPNYYFDYIPIFSISTMISSIISCNDF